ncbi:MAG TPA: PKD domain-containing protein, partial [Bacteroidia bacterium]|nr:PKD domain-containing protein [Bacteroidia bacterium]
STNVTQPPAITISTSSVDAHCNQIDGSVSASASGGTGTLNYQWNGGPASQNYNNIPAGNYSVVITDQNGCSDSSSVVVNNLNGVTASAGTVTNVTCSGQSDGSIVINANGGNPAYTYSWSPNVSATDTANGIPAGNYQVTVSDAAGCTSLVSVTVTEPPQLSVTAAASPSAVCEGSPLQLSSSANGGTPGYSFTWMPGNMSGANQNTVPASTTTYSVSVTDQNGCTATGSVNVIVSAMPVAAFAADTLSGCAPLCVNFSDLSTVTAPSAITSWNWDFGDGNISTQQNPSHCYDTPGIYTVVLKVTTAAGCETTITMTNYINAFVTPVAGFTYSPQPVSILDPEVFFTDTSWNAVTWSWSFGDLNNSSSASQNPSFVYPDATCYQVLLSVTSANGCTDTATQDICINPDVTLYIPNTFTPDGNGMNDVFLPAGIGLTNDNYDLMIFDRWGNLIFESHSLDQGWDGRANGGSEIAQIDTYVWKLHVTDILGKEHSLIGHVNLIK